MKLQIKDYIFHLTANYFAWFCGILLAARQKCWTAFFLIIAVSALQILWQLKIRNDSKYLFRIVFLLTLIGPIVDTLFLHFKIVYFNANPFYPYYSSPWMIAIWFNFSILFFSLVRNLFRCYSLIGILSLIAFPLSYFAGAKLGAASFPLGSRYCIVIGIVWAFLLPFCLYLYNTWGEKYA